MSGRGRAMIAVAAAVSLLAACGSGGDDASPSGLAKPTATASELLLTPADLPAGAVVVEVGRDELRAGRDVTLRLMEASTVTPATCLNHEQARSAARGVGSDKAAGLLAQLGDAVSVTETVVPDPGDFDALTAGFTGECARVTLDAAAEGQSFRVVLEAATVPAPAGLAADRAAVVRLTSTDTACGDACTGRPGEGLPTQYYGYAIVRGVLVEVVYLTPKAGDDRRTFDDLFVKAVGKVRQAA